MSNLEKMVNHVAAWCEENPVTLYADYRDELPDEIVNDLLEGNSESFDELLTQAQIGYFDCGGSGYHLDELRRDMESEFDEEDLDDAKDAIEEAFFENYQMDASDLSDGLLRHSTPHIVAILLDSEGNEYNPPNGDCDRDENADRIRRLRSIGIRRPWAIESMYEHESIKVCGTIDLEQFVKAMWKSGKTPDKYKVTFNSRDNLISHTSCNGSGGLGDIDVTGEFTLDCVLVNDKDSHYGVDAVYGFCNSWWQNDLELTAA